MLAELIEVAVSDDRTYASVPLASSAEMLDAGSAGPDELRKKAARYRLLAGALLDPEVIEVVLDCARELEMQASLAETAECIKRGVAQQGH